jgi:phospholipid/cholesterol/gamma-HCH transport system substrate-binding protein
MGGMSDVAKVGAAVLIVIAMMIGLGQLVNGRFLLPGSSYYVLVRFNDARGLRVGMPMKLSGLDRGSVENIFISKTKGAKQAAEAKIRVLKDVQLYPDASFTISRDGLIGEKFLQVIPGSDEQAPVEQGFIYNGEQDEDITELISKASQVIESVNTLLAPDALGGTIRDLSSSLSESLDKVNGLLEKAGGVFDASEGYVVGSLKNVHAMSTNFLQLSQNLEDASVTITKLANDPAYADQIKGITRDLTDVSTSLNHLSSQLDVLVSDPQMQQDAKDSVRLTKETLQEAKATLGRFQQTMDKADGLINSATGVMDGASGLIGDVSGAVGDARGKMDQLTNIGSNISSKASLNVRAVDKTKDHNLSGKDDYVGDINLSLGYGKTYVSAGADNIGADNNWNFLLGYGSLEGLSFRGGVYRGELGMGAAYFLQGGGGAEVMAYDTKEPKLNTYGYVPVGSKAHVVVGVEDVTDEKTATVGLGVDLR